MSNFAAYQEPIAVIGMSCRYPHSTNPTEFWQLLVNGGEGLGPIPQDRLEKGILSKDYKYPKANFLTIPIDEFDAKFFEISPRTAKYMDPQQRLLLEVTWNALEDASVNPQSLHGTTTGIFVGCWLQDYKNIGLLSPDKDFLSVHMGSSMAARIAFFLKTTGPSLDTESACSSSMVAVHLACKSLRDGSTNLCVVGGVNLLIEPPDGTDLDIRFVTSPDGRSKSFDADANGYGRGEGCGVLILKRLVDAVRDRDNILCLIRGSAVTQDGVSQSMGTPTVQCEALAMSLALKDAGVDPKNVSYIEAHGTGTKVGDSVEVAAIAEIYSSEERRSPLVIGSVKGNVGHSEACSGITSIIKIILAMKHELIPRQVNFKRPSPSINFQAIPAILPMENIKWPGKQDQPRLAGVSSFGISGTDCHVILQDFLELDSFATKPEMERPLHLINFSGKTEKALTLLLEEYNKHLQSTDSKFKDICYTANTGRALFDYRAVLLAGSKEEASRKLLDGNYTYKRVSRGGEKSGKVCILFPGQGSQYPGMAKDLYEHSPVFQFHFEECCKILEEENIGIDLKNVLWSDHSGELLKEPINCQVGIFCVNYCLFKLWTSWGIKPDYVLGHSLGESVAVVAVGVRDLKSGLKAVLLNCQLIDKLPNGKMIAVGESPQHVEHLTKKFLSGRAEATTWLDVAAVNSFEQTVLSGEDDTIEDFREFCKGHNVRVKVIASSHAFHSRMLDPALSQMREGLAVIHQSMPKVGSVPIKFISSSEARLVECGELLSEEYWVNNTRNAVQFMEAAQVAYSEGCRIFIEVGAQTTLSAFIKSLSGDNSKSSPEVVCLPSLMRNRSDWEIMLSSLARYSVSERGWELNWKEFDRPHSRRKVPIPNYPFIRESYLIERRLIQRPTSSGGSERAPTFWMEEWRPCSLSYTPNWTKNRFQSSKWVAFGGIGEYVTILNGKRKFHFDFVSTSDGINTSKKAVFKLLDSYEGKLEGILYMSSLCGESGNQKIICEPFLYILQWLQEKCHLPQVQSMKTVVVSRGLELVTEEDLISTPSQATLVGMLKVFRNECPNLSMKCIDLCHQTKFEDQVESLLMEMLSEDGAWKYDQIALRKTGRYAARFVGAPKLTVSPEMKSPLFKYRCSCYMITGGLRGLGFQVAAWMLENGARHLILVGRNSSSAEVREWVNGWNSKGRRVQFYRADIGKISECAKLFDWIKQDELPPLRGIFHCAGVLADATVSNQSWRNFESVFCAKVDGSWNLHELSLYYKLDYFVMFSSVSSMFGIPGQSNYAAGNCYEDALARYRQSLGLPGTSVNWVLFKDIGMAPNLSFPGVTSMTVEQGLEALEFVLRSNLRQRTVGDFYSFRDFAALCPRAINYVDCKLLEPKKGDAGPLSKFQLKIDGGAITRKSFLEQSNLLMGLEERTELIEKFVESAVRDVLRMDACQEKSIDNLTEFHSLGVDSLMMVELLSKLQETFGDGLILTASHLRDYPSISSLTRKLTEEMRK